MQMLTYRRVMSFLELFERIDAVECTTIMETAKKHIIDKVNFKISCHVTEQYSY
jgi:hypothetical protein